VLHMALERLAMARPTDTTLIEDLLTGVPRSTVVLANWAARLAARLVELRGAEAEDSERALVVHAEAHQRLAFRLAQLSSHVEALHHAEEAVRLCRAAVERFGAEPDKLIDSLLNWGARLAGLGSASAAVLAGEEAVLLSRELDRQREEQSDRTQLATALHHQAKWLHDVRRYTDAERVGAEAVRIRTHLAELSTHYRADLASSSMNYAGYLQDVDRPGEALPYARSAVEAYQGLAEDSPDAHLVWLGRALTGLVRLLAALGDTTQALTYAEDAVHVYRQFVREDMVDPQEELSIAVANYGRRLVACGRLPEAVRVFEEAEQLCDKLVARGSRTAADRLAVVRRDLEILRRHPGGG
jgi:hypothetical protein